MLGGTRATVKGSSPPPLKSKLPYSGGSRPPLKSKLPYSGGGSNDIYEAEPFEDRPDAMLV